ncbi:AAA family ATPase [Nitrospirillum pindoramense]|uniref:Putative ATP-binding protein involved in virulence n=1 Tax=Nitrospirillum amazonense TaxID=28077 RepID=A0A560H8C7_9PROT|nr:AAA family ATPase [Nitrospirillum amazonense]TWB42585.1 putative ATP-binding protein involved in virulence [Nitrospirillum amazonense]
MKIQKLRIKGFRGIRDVNLDLDARLTVFVGANGAGKTTVLDAISVLLDNYVARFVRASPSSAKRIGEMDINTGCSEAELTVEVGVDSEVVSWTVRRQRRVSKILGLKSSDFEQLNSLIRKKVATKGDDLSGEPLMVYYGQRRAILDVPMRIRNGAEMTALAAFRGTLAVGDLNFRDFIAWFRDRSLLELQQKQLKKNPKNYVDIQLEAVRKAMTSATDMENPVYKVEVPFGLYVTKKGKQLRVDQLSSGESAYLALAGDLARRLAMANPNSSNPLDGAAIVLIDEVELHLHPVWQRKIIPWLCETFRNCQFIISTHSAQVLGLICADEIRIMKIDENTELKVMIPDASRGRDSNFLLLNVLGGDERDIDLKEKLDDLQAAIIQGENDRAEGLLSVLRGLMEGSPPELIIAQARIERNRRVAQE